jgi:hypothetical protein
MATTGGGYADLWARTTQTFRSFYGFLRDLPIGSWMLSLHLVNRLRLGQNYSGTISELVAGHGNIKPATFTAWKSLYQRRLGDAVVASSSNVVGAGGATVVVDETVVGVDKADGWPFESKGINKRDAKQKRLTAQN